jgi:hypothetical protein
MINFLFNKIVYKVDLKIFNLKFGKTNQKQTDT